VRDRDQALLAPGARHAGYVIFYYLNRYTKRPGRPEGNLSDDMKKALKENLEGEKTAVKELRERSEGSRLTANLKMPAKIDEPLLSPAQDAVRALQASADPNATIKHSPESHSQLRKTAPPTSAVLEQIRENAMRSILNSETEGRSQ
jgi:hypothetical protein